MGQYIHAQNIALKPKSKLELGLSATLLNFEYGSRLGTELSMLYHLKNRWYGSMKIGTNFCSAASLKLGFRYGIIEKGRFRLFTGLDYSIDFYKRYYNEGTTFTSGLELPLELSVRVKNNTHFNIGMSTYICKSQYNTYNTHSSQYLIDAIRVGISKKF